MNAVHYFWQLRICTDDLMDGYLTFDEWEAKKAKLRSEIDALGLYAQVAALEEQMKRDGIQSIPTK